MRLLMKDDNRRLREAYDKARAADGLDPLPKSVYTKKGPGVTPLARSWRRILAMRRIGA
jgi:hypothetical protein